MARYLLYGIELDFLEDEPRPCNVEASIVTNIMVLDSLYIFIELYSSAGYPQIDLEITLESVYAPTLVSPCVKLGVSRYTLSSESYNTQRTLSSSFRDCSELRTCSTAPIKLQECSTLLKSRISKR